MIKKIIHINEYYGNIGGTEKYLLNICKALEDRGYEVVIIASSEKESIHVPGRKEYFIKGSYGLKSSLRMKDSFYEIVARENPDIIHLHNTQYFLSPLILKYLLRLKPIVKTVHDIRLFCPGFRWKIIPAFDEICNYPMGLQCFRNGCYPFHPEKGNLLWNLHKFLLMMYELKVSKSVDKITVPSSYIGEQLIKNGFPKENIAVIPHYVDNALIQEKEIKNNTKKILFVGKLDRIKGILQFIESLNLLETRDWVAEIIGEGKLQEDASALVEKLGLNDRVRFLGNLPTEELNKYYANCSIVVIPSMVPESFGLVGIEAMAAGKPVVAFDSGGIKEWLVNGETGFLVKRGDIRELTHRISQLLDDDLLTKKMGLECQKRVNERYRKEIHLKQLFTIYEEAIRKRKQEGC
ncbi:MAG: glycosyltransferase family 1 protein [wastewater metagenome]|nr:glycosyltransferase family 1 protein [Candidatus Loosdrechtia aerotolerans]